MTDPADKSSEPVDVALDVPLDQTSAPIDYLQEGPTGAVPLDQTISKMRQVLGSEGLPPLKRRSSS